MQHYSFDEYVGKRDVYEEGWRDWLPWGQGSEPKKAARVLTPSEQQPYIDPRVAASPRISQPAAAVQQPTHKFSGAYLSNIADTTEQYLNMVSNFAKTIRQQVINNPESARLVAKSFQQLVGPHLEKLKDWILWARTMVSQLPRREWEEDENELFIEAIKVNYKNFENMASAMQNMTGGIRSWVNSLGQVPQLAPYMGRIQNAFNNKIVLQSGQLAKVFQSMGEKVKALMSVHGREYQGLPSGPSQSPDFGGYGSKLAGQMQAGQQAAQYKVGSGERERQNVAAAQARERMQQQTLPSRPKRPTGSLLSRG